MAEAHNPEALQDIERAAPPPPVATTEVVPPPAEPVAGTGIVPESLMGMDWGAQNYLLAMFSIIVMISSSVVCGNVGFCTGILGYQVALSSISAFIALLSGVLAHKGNLSNRRAKEGISAFQFLWWLAGVIVLTFFGSFQFTTNANGYFGSWGSFFFASLLLITASPRFENELNKAYHSPRKPLLFLAWTSGIAMGAAIGPCSAGCAGYPGYAISLGSISLFLSLVLLIGADKIPAKSLRGISAFLVLWWIIGVPIVTFGAPFTNTGNGYFASYGALISSVAVLSTVSNL